jgi:hypothetical protein
MNVAVNYFNGRNATEDVCQKMRALWMASSAIYADVRSEAQVQGLV